MCQLICGCPLTFSSKPAKNRFAGWMGRLCNTRIKKEKLSNAPKKRQLKKKDFSHFFFSHKDPLNKNNDSICQILWPLSFENGLLKMKKGPKFVKNVFFFFQKLFFCSFSFSLDCRSNGVASGQYKDKEGPKTTKKN